MKTLTDKIIESLNDSSAYQTFLNDLKPNGFKRNEINEIRSSIPDWVNKNNIKYVDSDSLSLKMTEYMTDSSNFTNSKVITTAKYGDDQIEVCWNDNVFALLAGDASALLYKNGFNFGDKKSKKKKDYSSLSGKICFVWLTDSYTKKFKHQKFVGVFFDDKVKSTFTIIMPLKYSIGYFEDFNEPILELPHDAVEDIIKSYADDRTEYIDIINTKYKKKMDSFFKMSGTRRYKEIFYKCIK